VITRLAALYDIHGNLPALESVLADVNRASVDHIVVGGDVIPGPMPRETLARLCALHIPTQFIFGNGEIAVLREHDGQVQAVPQQVGEIIGWTAHQLDDPAVATLRTWPKTLSIDLPVIGRVMFCHATPRNENECFTDETPEERLLPIFDHAGAALVVCGHTHMQFDRMIGRTRVVNAGSVGMPFGRPGAGWLLIDHDSVALRHTDYDLESAAARVRGTDYPQRDEFAQKNILSPPSADEMRQTFARVELR
jgi:predicted phosphodiesterase